LPFVVASAFIFEQIVINLPNAMLFAMAFKGIIFLLNIMCVSKVWLLDLRLDSETGLLSPSVKFATPSISSY